MKSVLISIQPYWVFLIIARIIGWNIPQEKTVEVRKDCPKDPAWNKRVLIYCSKNRKSFNRIPKQYQPFMEKLLGKVVGEFVCDMIYNLFPWGAGIGVSDENDKLVDPQDFVNWSCVEEEKIVDYIGIECGEGYGWHISDLKIYDKPKELDEFGRDMPLEKAHALNSTTYGKYDCCHCLHHEWLKDKDGVPNGEKCHLDKPEPICEPRYSLTRPPQSWCYVEVQ